MTRVTRSALAILVLAIPAGIAAGGRLQAEIRPDEAAHAFVQAYNTHNPDALMALYADDVVVTAPDLTEVKGKPQNRKYYQAWFDSVPDVKNTIRTLTVEDDRFVLELMETGTYRKRMPSPGSPAARGQSLRYPYVMIGQVRAGKIARLRIYENDLVLEKQLGMR